MNRYLRGVALVAVAVAVGGAGWWAGRTSIEQGVVPTAGQTTATSATAVELSLGRSISLSVSVNQPLTPVAVNSLPGTVTEVKDAATETAQGTVLYAVNQQPVIAAQGSTPFYRDLSVGVSGPDVAQLQRLLTSLSLYGAAETGVFDTATGDAVKAWQQNLGQPATGSVPLGSLMAVPRLPGVVKLGDGIHLGALLGGGELAASAQQGSPGFDLVVAAQQAALIPVDAVIDVQLNDLVWPARISSSSVDQNGDTTFLLTAPDGGLVCGADCGQLPAVEQGSLRAQITLVPAVTGPAVPVAALHSMPDGSVYVVAQDGRTLPVKVLASTTGMAVVSGLSAGATVTLGGNFDASRATPIAGTEPGPTTEPTGAPAGTTVGPTG